MAKSIDDEMLELSREEMAKFKERLTDVHNSGSWRALRGLQMATELEIARVLYGEMYKDDFSYLNRSFQTN